VDMSLIEAGVSLMFSPLAMHDHVKGDWSKTSRNDGNAPSGFFMTSDGSYLTVFASYPALWERFVNVMGLQHLSDEPRFCSRDQRTTNAKALHEIIGKIFLTNTTNHWVQLLNKAGVPASRVNDVESMIADDQIAARQMIVKQHHPIAGDIRVVGVPVKLSKTPGGVHTPAPILGEHSEEIIRSLGHDDKLTFLRSENII